MGGELKLSRMSTTFQDLSLDMLMPNFFVTKSSSKENLLSSNIHGVWESTYGGNRKLNAAYVDAASGEQMVQGGTFRASSPNFPISLLFSFSSSIFLN